MTTGIALNKASALGLPMQRLRSSAIVHCLIYTLLMLVSACSWLPSSSAKNADTEVPAAADQVAPTDPEQEYAERQWQVLPFAELMLPRPLDPNEFILSYEGQRVIGEPQRVTARWEDTLADLGRAYGLGYDEIVAANPDIDPWLPGEGTSILLPTQYILPDAPHAGLVLNIAAKRLFYYPPTPEGSPARVLTYPIGVGRVGWNTPLGNTRIIAKAKDPAWVVPASIRREHAADGDPLPAVVPPGPNNPLGRYSLRLSRASYLLHGTNKPYGVGMRVSHGCVRLYPESIEQLYSLVDVGERVNIVNQPYLMAWHHGEFYLQAYVPQEDDALAPAQRIQQLMAQAEAESGAFHSMGAQAQLLTVANAASGMPVRLLREDVDQVSRRARTVRNLLEVARMDAADLVY